MNRSNVLARLLLAAWIALSGGIAAAQDSSERSPILVTFDLHMDPIPLGPSLAPRQAYVEAEVEAAGWLLDQVEPRGAKLSFTMGGDFAEMCLLDPDGTYPLLRRLYENGGSIGTHTHDQYRSAPYTWRRISGDTPENADRLWADHVDLVDQVVLELYGDADAGAPRSINNLRGTHIPAQASERFALYEEYGFDACQPGPTEDFYALFNHYMFHPFRSSVDNELDHDPAGPLVALHAGPVLGSNDVHKGTVQDMRPEVVKARFLLTVLNWLHDVKAADVDRVWMYGWGCHATDVEESGVTRSEVVPMLDWFDSHFIGKSIQGRVLAEYGSYREAVDAHETWEAANPGASARAYASRDRDWSLYPWLVPAAAYLWAAEYVEPLRSDAAVQVHRLVAADALGGYPIVVAFPVGTRVPAIDLSSIDAGAWVRIDPATAATKIVSATGARVPLEGAIFVRRADLVSLDEQKNRIETGWPAETLR